MHRRGYYLSIYGALGNYCLRVDIYACFQKDIYPSNTFSF